MHPFKVSFNDRISVASDFAATVVPVIGTADMYEQNRRHLEAAFYIRDLLLQERVEHSTQIQKNEELKNRLAEISKELSILKRSKK